MSTLPKFVADDSEAITQEMIAVYEAMSGKTLYPGQVERLLIDVIAYRETLVRAAINDSARQNLVEFARAPMLDYLGELVGVSRLPARRARTTVRIVFAAVLVTALAIPAGTRMETASGVQFQTVAETLADAGRGAIEIAVEAVEPGLPGNGYLAGQVSILVDELGVEVGSIANLAVTSAGADEESDDRLRVRIKLAPEAFSVAGSRLAYRHHAMSAHQDIVDVAVLSPAPGVVRLHPLVAGGLPGAAMLEAVIAACSDEKVRPLSDLVEVMPPSVTDYQVRARLTVYRGQDVTAVMANARAQVDSLVARQATGLGRDIVPAQFVAALSVPGVYDVQLLAPASIVEIGEAGWAQCTLIDLELAGGSDG
ncbi:MAG: baseplate J/gp47 family protein [Duganella sp.]